MHRGRESGSGRQHAPAVLDGLRVPRELSKLVIFQTLGATLIGIGIGLTGALMATRLIASRLFAVSALDPATFLGAAFVLVSIALAASYVPARRAMTVDPLVALRAD
jgi:putative ABC transport system permease protein